MESIILLSIFSILNVSLTLFIVNRNKEEKYKERIDIFGEHLKLHQSQFKTIGDNLLVQEDRITYIEKFIEIIYTGNQDKTMH